MFPLWKQITIRKATSSLSLATLRKELSIEYRDNYPGKELIGTVPWGRFMDLLDVCELMPPPWRLLDEMGRKIHPNVTFTDVESGLRKLFRN
jgi:hypothetical protein